LGMGMGIGMGMRVRVRYFRLQYSPRMEGRIAHSPGIRSGDGDGDGEMALGIGDDVIG
jgi:hypothetical protein